MAKAKKAKKVVSHKKVYNPNDSVIVQLGVAVIVVAAIFFVAYAVKVFF